MGHDSNFMRIMYCSPEQEPKILKIEKELEKISELMQTPFFETTMYKGMILVYNPKGILKYSKIQKLDGLNLRGPFIFTGNDTSELDFKSLNIEQIRYLQKHLTQEKEIEKIEEIEM